MRFLLSSLLSLLFLFVSCVSASPSHASQRFYAGRSAPIQFQPQQAADLFCVLHDPTSRYFTPSSTIPNEMSVFNVFDGATTAMGLPTLNQEHTALNFDFVHSQLFDRPRANVFIGVDAVGRNNVQAEVMPHLFHMIADRETSKSSASASIPFSLTDTQPSILSPALPTVTSIATASSVSAHGIVNRVWEGKHGSPVNAYSAGDASSWAHRATFADILSQSFNGKSMTLSFSSNRQVAAAFGVNAVLQHEKSDWNNFIITLDETGVAFTSAHDSPSTAALHRSLSSLKADIFSSSSFLHQLSISNSLFSYSLDAAKSQVKLTHGTSTIVFDLNKIEDLRFFAELQYIHALPELVHSSPQLSELITDSYPDALAINIAATDELAMHYGADSAKFQSALMLLDAALPSLQHRIYALYPERAVGELVALGSAFAGVQNENALFETLSNLASPSWEEYFPLFYIPPTQAVEKCAEVNAAVQPFGLNAECLQTSAQQAAIQQQVDVQQQQMSSSFVSQAAVGLAASSTSLSAFNSSIFIPTYYPSENGIERYQIVLWVSVLLAFVLLGVIYSSAYMSFKKDTMLYSTFNPRWEDKKSR